MNVLNTKSNNYNLPFKKLGDLIYHEGPILSLYIDDDANMFLYRWVDCDDYINKWMVSSISSFELSQLYHKTISLRQYYEACNQRAIIEIDNSLKINKLYPLEFLPNDYLPKENSFYFDNLYTEFSNSLKAMYTNNLALVSQHKLDIYEVFVFDTVGNEDNQDDTNDSSKKLTNKKNKSIKDITRDKFVKDLTKDFLPKSSDVTEIVQLFRALNHNIRKRILDLVSKTSGITITDICSKLKIEQSMASQQVAILRRSNLLITQRKGNLVLYVSNYKKLEDVQAAIDTLIEDKKIVYQ